MRVYLAGERELDLNEAQTCWSRSLKRRLFSYYYNGAQKDNKPSEEIKKTLSVTKDLFLDSGAFSAYTKGVSLSVDKYAAFMHEADIWTCKSNLDDIGGDSKLTYDNQKALESLGCDVCPVFHPADDIKWLVKYLDEGYEYIFLGGMVIQSTKFLHMWLDRLWGQYLTNADGSPRVKVHGFGLTTYELMVKYPWFSVDSSSWLMKGIYGSCALELHGKYVDVTFSESSSRVKDLESRHYNNLTASEKKIVDGVLESIGVRGEDCIKHYMYRDIVNAYSYTAMESHATDRFVHQQVGLFDV